MPQSRVMKLFEVVPILLMSLTASGSNTIATALQSEPGNDNGTSSGGQQSPEMPDMAAEDSCCAADDEGTVTVDNFECAESDTYFAKFVGNGGFGQFAHTRTPIPVTSAEQDVIRMNQDTLYSGLVIDLDAGPATITIPDTGGRFQSTNIISECHDSLPPIYDAGKTVVSKEEVGTRYAMVLLRIFVDGTNETDIETANKLQDEYKVEQADIGAFEPTKWNQDDLNKIRKALLVLGKTSTTPGEDMYGMRNETDRLSHVMGTAAGWGAAQTNDTRPVFVVPAKNDGETAYTLTVPAKADVPIVDNAFWSVTVYNSDGFMFPPGPNSFNDATAEKNEDGTVTLNFGQCDDAERKNCIPIEDGWNYLVRLYRPKEAILNGSWTFPDATEG